MIRRTLEQRCPSSRAAPRKVCWAALVVAVASLWLAAGAGAATYEVWSCRGPDPAAAPVSTAAWKLDAFSDEDGSLAGIVLADECQAGGGLRIGLAAGTSFPKPTTAMATFDLPPGTQIADYTLWRSIEVAAAAPGDEYHYRVAVQERKGGSTEDRGCASTTALPSFDGCTTKGDPNTPLDEEQNRFDALEPPLDGLRLWAGCDRGQGCDGSAPAPAELQLFRSRVLVEDPTPPELPELSGSLAGEQPVSGLATLSVESADVGGGIAAMTLSVDDGVAQTLVPSTPGDTCSQPYTAARPCPAGARQTFAVDTDSLDEGEHSASGTVVDAAGNSTPFGPLAFSVERPDPPSPGDDPVAEPPEAEPRPQLRLRRHVIRHRLGRPARIVGALRTDAGRPIAGARLTVAIRRLAGRGWTGRSVRTIGTSNRGRFALTLRGAGARSVRISYAPPGGRTPPATAEATVRAPTSLSLRRAPARLRRGETVLLQGRLRGAGAAARGALVEVQAIVGGRWRAVATVRATRNGRFRWRYRFTRVSRDTIFAFRTVVWDTPGWPWGTTRSRPVRVWVDGA